MMIKYIIGKIFYGISILFGVVTVVFFIFNLGGDPVENLVAENSSQEIKNAIRKKLNLDLSLGERYRLYLNDISPISLHHPTNKISPFYFDKKKYSGNKIISLGNESGLYLKTPFLNRSYLTERKVGEVLSEVIPSTAILAILAITIALILGVVIGVFSALNRGTLMDHFALFLSVIGMSGPSFFMAIIIAWVGGLLWYETTSIPAFPIVFLILFGVGSWLYKKKYSKTKLSISKYLLYGLFTGIGFWLIGIMVDSLNFLSSSINLPGTHLPMNGSLIDVDVWKGEFINPKNLILPAITLGIRPLAVIVQLTRSSMLDELSKDYIRTARAKGLSENKVVFKHALKNAMNPVVTAVSGWFASLLAGAVFVEFVFGYRGLGLTIYEALEKDDMPIVMGAVIIIAASFVMMNFIVDIIYGLIDPRVRNS